MRNLSTDASGQYVAPDLLPGTYTVHVALMGFKTVDRQGILLETGRDSASMFNSPLAKSRRRWK